MPKIQWLEFPSELRQHLFDRAKERQITMQDLFALEEWRRHEKGISTHLPKGPYDIDSKKVSGAGGGD
jgi:hypothetical protein